MTDAVVFLIYLPNGIDAEKLGIFNPHCESIVLETADNERPARLALCFPKKATTFAFDISKAFQNRFWNTKCEACQITCLHEEREDLADIVESLPASLAEALRKGVCAVA